MGDDFDGSISLGRKLSEEETHELRITLLPYFHSEGGMESDDINDFLDYTFTMLSNDKTIEYIVGEYAAFFSPEVSKKIGNQLAIRIKELKGGEDGDYVDKEPKSDGKDDIATPLKSGGEARGNALTMSGALGASREGGRNKKDEKKEPSEKKDEGRGGKDKGRGDRREGKRGRGTERTVETFDRLAKGRDDRGRGRGRDKGHDSHEDGRRGREDGRKGRDSREDGRKGDNREDGRDRRGDERDGRGGRGQGRGRDMAPRGGPRDMGALGGPRDIVPRGGPRDMGPRGGPRDMGPRGGPRSMDTRGGRDGGRFGRGDRGAPGQRRNRDEFEEEADFVPAAEGRGGRGRGHGRGHEGPKRPRYDESYEEGHGYGGFDSYDDGYEYYPPMRGGRGRGRFPGRGRFGRGRGYDGAEGATSWGDSGGHEAAHGEGSGEVESSGAHPSPMVRASFGGRGFRGRGFIRGGAGRGRFGGREQIVSMIQSKTWVRKKDGEDSGGGGDAGAAES